MNELINHFKSKQISVEERLLTGKALRGKFPHHELGKLRIHENRPDPVDILEEQAKTRLKDLVPIRYSRMLTSPFAFLRGAAAVMAYDLAADSLNTGIQVQLCGDMHVSNFGLFASAERKLIFGINDFDETIPGPWEWDIKRFVTSIVVSGKFLDASDKLCRKAVIEAVKSYRRHLYNFAKMGYLDLWYAAITEKKLKKALPEELHKALKKIAGKARGRTHLQVLGKMTDIVDDKFLLKENAPYIIHETHTFTGMLVDEALGFILDSYLNSLSDDRKALLKQYRIVDVARKVVGVGSVGTRCWIVFLKGNNNTDPLFLQVKEAQPSVFEKYLHQSEYTNHGQRVVSGQRVIQAAPDIFLGWGEYEGIHFYVRQLRDMKGGVEIEPGKTNVKALPEYSKLCAWALALAHAKSGDAAMIAGYLGEDASFGEAMADYAFAYAAQNERDFRALQAAADTKRIHTFS